MTLRYLDPFDSGTMGPWDSWTLGPLPFCFVAVWYGFVCVGGCQMTSEFICEEISMLLHSEKFYGGRW